MKRTIALVSVVLMLGGCAPQPEIQQPAIIPPKPCINAAQLNAYGYDHLERVARLLREDKKSIESFEGFINAMKGTVDNYADMIKSSVYISNVVRYLPIPYVGEVCSTTKLISKTLLNLGGAASALNRYKNSSDYFLVNFDKLNRSTAKGSEIAKLAIYADTKLMDDVQDLENGLKEISASAQMMAATTQAIADGLERTNGYVNNAKNFVGFSKPEGDDSSTVIQSRNSINTRMGQLSQKIASLEMSGKSHRYNIVKARIYSQLAMQLEGSK